MERVGIRKGIAKGKVEGGAEVVLRILRRRFGALSEDAESQIRYLSLSQIEALSDALFDLASQDDLQAWLLANPPQTPAHSVIKGDLANGTLPMES